MIEEKVNLKDKVKQKLEERILYILDKKVEEISNEEFMALSSKLFNLENEETKEERNKEYVDLITKVITR